MTTTENTESTEQETGNGEQRTAEHLRCEFEAQEPGTVCVIGNLAWVRQSEDEWKGHGLIYDSELLIKHEYEGGDVFILSPAMIEQGRLRLTTDDPRRHAAAATDNNRKPETDNPKEQT